MPNWCNNSITVSHPDRSKMEALVSAVKEGNFLKHIVPIPEELQDTTAPNRDALNAEELRVKYGASDWYDFCVSRWGTKWDVDAYSPNDLTLDNHNTLQFGFDSAWAPPTGIYDEMVKQGYDVTATYYESGMAFCGCWTNGEDECWNLADMSADEVAGTIPVDLDEEYGISECMREYEEESRE